MRESISKNILLLIGALTIGACGNIKSSRPSSKNVVKVSDSADQLIEENGRSFHVVNQRLLTDDDGAENSLLVGFPKALLGKDHIFGGVITKVSDKERSDLGMLKLSDLPPVHVKPLLATEEESLTLLLKGCVDECVSGSEQVNVEAFPVLKEEGDFLYIDFSEIGEGFNLVAMMDPNGEYTKLVAHSSETVMVDYSEGTLIFDVESTMIPKDSMDLEKAVKFQTRWYLKEHTSNTENFKAQKATKGVGFFMTDRSRVKRVTRFAQKTNEGSDKSVHYFVKNVPAEFQIPFAQAFDSWNETFTDVIGRDLLTYEFVSEEDEISELLVPGDIRYNIVEWDLVNQAPYGGLGPSMADQNTGEILSANVYVQGPTIVKLYTEWFEANRSARALRMVGQELGALKLLKATEQKLLSKSEALKDQKWKLTLGGSLEFDIRSQKPELQDPLVAKLQFDPVPEGLTYAEYMHGYFLELVAHELGHNLGLRHNFRGNLFDDGSGGEGSVSASIMEYLGRNYRHLNRISDYDTMAISYGYAQVRPSRTDMFCTDENVGQLNGNPFTSGTQSAECSRDDAESDPFAYFERQFTSVRDLLVARDSAVAPVWTMEEIARYYQGSINGMLLYGKKSKNFASWTHFFKTADRPDENSEAVKAYVSSVIKSVTCDAALEAELKEIKDSDESLEASLKNLKLFQDASILRIKETLPNYSFNSCE